MSKSSNMGLAQGHLRKALTALDNINESNETKSFIIRALHSLERVSGKNEQKKQANTSQHDKWWGTITAGAVKASHAQFAKEAPFAREAQIKKLQALDELVKKQEKILEELEKEGNKPTNPPQILNE